MAEAPVVIVPTHGEPVAKQKITGRISAASPDLEEFRGIPYGIAPGRWQHSTFRRRLPSDDFDATRDGVKCPQPAFVNNTDTYQSFLDFPNPGEDELECLNLLVVRPSARALEKVRPGLSKERVPVLVWIHGGGFGFGAATDPPWDPARLVASSLACKTPFIAVNINYRLGIFGFAGSHDILVTQDPSSSAILGINFGLRDQHVALEWISRNISAFGGDPNKICLGGQSAGGKSVHIHALEAKYSPAKPLFRKVLPMSGAIGCLGPQSLDAASKSWDLLCKKFQCNGESAQERVSGLTEVPVDELLNAGLDNGWVSYPVVTDGLTLHERLDVPGGVDFIQQNHADGGEQAYVRPIEVLMGETEEEGSLFAQGAKLPATARLQEIFRKAFPTTELADSLLKAYGFTGEVTPDSLLQNYTQFLTDAIFAYNVYVARRHFTSNNLLPSSSTSSSTSSGSRATDGADKQQIDPSQCYHKTALQPYRIQFGNAFPGKSYGVSHHCVDLVYLFDNFYKDIEKYDREPLIQGSAEMQETMRSRVSNAEIRRTLQDRLIDFVTRDEVRGMEKLEDARISVWGMDGRVREEALQAFEDRTSQTRRFELLGKYPLGAQYVRQVITGELVGAEPAEYIEK